MKRFLLLLGLSALLFSCNNAARREAAREQARLDSIARAEAVRDSIAAAKKLKKRIKEAEVTAAELPEEPVFDIITNLGTIKVRLFKDTPKHRDNFVKLALAGYYDSLLFHRVIKDFMIQGGDPFTRDTARADMYGQGGPDYTIPAEFVKDEEGQPLHRHVKGALAAARRGDFANPMKESSGSQFYLVSSEVNCRHLDGEYTVFGETVAGLNVIDKIAAVKTDRYDRPVRDVRIRRIKPDKELNKADAKVEAEKGKDLPAAPDTQEPEEEEPGI